MPAYNTRMPTIEASIWLALKARIDTLPLLFDKAWPAEKFLVPSAGGMPTPYLRIGKITIAPSRQFIADGKPHERNGTLMVTLVYPLGQEVAAYEQLQGHIAAHFKDGTQMRYANVCVNVPRYPHCVEGYEDSGYWTAPVSIPWRCFA